MPLRRLPSARSTLIAAMLGLSLFAGEAVATTQFVEPQTIPSNPRSTISSPI
jgi:hypothetical protein